MTTDEDDVLAECGLSLADVAVSAARVFAAVSKADVDEEHPGWEALARHALAMFRETDDADRTLSVSEFAAMLRRAFARAADPEAEIPPLDTLPRHLRVAWETAARHMANVCNLDPRDARHLGQHEERIAQVGLARLAPAP